MARKWRWEFCNYSKTKFCMKNYLCATGSLKDHEPSCAPVLLNFSQKQDFEWLKFICVNLTLQTGRIFSNPTDRLLTGKFKIKTEFFSSIIGQKTVLFRAPNQNR